MLSPIIMEVVVEKCQQFLFFFLPALVSPDCKSASGMKGILGLNAQDLHRTRG